MISEIHNNPTYMSSGFFVSLLSNVKDGLEIDFDAYRSGTITEVNFRDILEDSYYTVDSGGGLELRIDVSVLPGGAPISEIRFVPTENAQYTFVNATFPSTVRGGESREGTINLKVSEKAVEDGVLDIYASVAYSVRGAVQPTLRPLSLTINLQSNEQFMEIPNPYERFRTGSPIDDPEMFFGREEIVNRITSSIKKRPTGQCFVLYGQKRSGKTSILFRLKDHLIDRFLPVYISLGAVSDEGTTLQEELYALIIGEIVSGARKIGLNISDPFRSIPNGKPVSYPVMMRTVIEEVNETHIAKFGIEKNVVLLIDEFTFIYDWIKEGITKSTFMRNWKNIIESGMVSAVLVGQDSMPRFFEEYSNEFGVSEKERLSYLNQKSSEQLCDKPISHESGSRYRGNARGRIYEITNGSAFFLQKFCYELVEYLNERRRPFITKVDVDHVFKQLVEGDKALQEADFDPMLQEAGFKTSQFSKDENMAVLRVIANRSQDNRGANLSGIDLPSEWRAIVEDLQKRDVVVSDAQARYRISMELFAEWLRVNRPI